MKKNKLIFHFHNPNTAEATADYMISILISANRAKVERAIQDTIDRNPNPNKTAVDT